MRKYLFTAIIVWALLGLPSGVAAQGGGQTTQAAGTAATRFANAVAAYIQAQSFQEGYLGTEASFTRQQTVLVNLFQAIPQVSQWFADTVPTTSVPNLHYVETGETWVDLPVPEEGFNLDIPAIPQLGVDGGRILSITRDDLGSDVIRPYFDVAIPQIGDKRIGFAAHYQRWTDDAGHTLIATTPGDALLMNLTDTVPAHGVLIRHQTNVVGTLISYLGGTTDWGQRAGMPGEGTDYVDAARFDPLNLIQINLALNYQNWQDGKGITWYSDFYVYEGDPGIPGLPPAYAQNVPGGGPGTPPGGPPGNPPNNPPVNPPNNPPNNPPVNPPNNPPHNPPDGDGPPGDGPPPAEWDPPTGINDCVDFPVNTHQPPYPLVVGQDTQDPPRGVDFIVDLKSPPCSYQKWGCIQYEYYEVYSKEKDKWVTRKRCIEEGWVWTAALDPIRRVRITADLSAQSIHDIEQGYIQQKYPNAAPYQPQWIIYEAEPPRESHGFVVDEFGPEGLSYIFRGSYEKARQGKGVSLQDPGLYSVTVRVTTRGIDPSNCSGKTQYCERCTPGQTYVWHCADALKVWMVMGSLISGE